MTPSPQRGIAQTLEVLRETPNEAAVGLLLSGLDASQAEIQDGALQALLSRRATTGQRELLRRWKQLPSRWKKSIADQPRRIASAVRDAILSTDERLCEQACDALLWIREYDLIPALLTSAEEPSNPNSKLTAQTLLKLTNRLHEELFDEQTTPSCRDPQRSQTLACSCLETAIDRYDAHFHREILESFLLVADTENATLRNVLRSPRHKSYLTLLDMLMKGQHSGITRLILGFLDKRQAPATILNVISHRSDPEFIRHLLKRVGEQPTETVRGNLKRIDSIRWLRDDLRILNHLDPQLQANALAMVIASNMPRLEAYQIVAHVLNQGRGRGRQVAAAALAEFGGVEANQLALKHLSDEDPVVRASLVGQLRERSIPGAISKVIQCLDDPDEAVRAAAQESLAEFTFDRYLSSFDMLDDEIRQSTGRLVMKVDAEAIDKLSQELRSSTRTRRLRALEVATAMNAVHEIEPLIISFLAEEDHFMRAESARALGMCDTALARRALREALMDRSIAVQEAAEHALQKLGPLPSESSQVKPATFSSGGVQ